MSYALMCCDCRRYLGKDGLTVDLGLPKGGVIPLHELALLSQDAEESVKESVAIFSRGVEAEDAARNAGWQVEDSNHRCPSCRPATEGAARGALVPWDRTK